MHIKSAKHNKEKRKAIMRVLLKNNKGRLNKIRRSR